MSTALLATLKGVVKDGSTPVVSRHVMQPMELAQYTAGHFLVEYVNEDGTPHSLAYDTPLHAVRLHPKDSAPAISLQGSVLDADPDGDPADNWARFELVPGHWADVPPRIYGHEGVLLIEGDPDDRVVVIPYSQWKTTPAAVHPGDEVSAPEAQAPLLVGPEGSAGAQGEPGEQGEQGEPGEQGPAGEQGPPGAMPEVASADIDAVLTPASTTPNDFVWKRRARGVITFTEGGALYHDVDLSAVGFEANGYDVQLTVFQPESDGHVAAFVVPSSGSYPTLAAAGFRVRLVDTANCKVFYRAEAL